MPGRAGFGATGLGAAAPLGGGHIAAGPQGAGLGFQVPTPHGPVGAHVAAGPNGMSLGATGHGASVQTHAHAGPGGLQMGGTVVTPQRGVQRVGLGVAAPLR